MSAASVTFHVYENWTIRKAAIHRSDCGHCNYGQGKHRAASTRNGQWHGPFNTYAAARRIAGETGQPVSDCGHCVPGSERAPARSRRGSSVARLPRGPRLPRDQRVQERVRHLILSFEHYVTRFADDPEFNQRQLSLHRQTVERRREHSSIREMLDDETFFQLLHDTLVAWRMSRGGYLPQWRELWASIQSQEARLTRLGSLRLDRLPSPQVADVAIEVWDLIVGVRASTSASPLVAGSKVTHHLLPDLMPPVDRAFTLEFFARKNQAQGSQQERAFKWLFPYLAEIARATAGRIQPIPGPRWNTSSTKVIDNAIVGWVIENLKQGRGTSQ